MAALLLLVILVSGFSYCQKHPEYYYRLHRYEGQYLYLQSGKLGLFCFLISCVFNYLLLKILSTPINICSLGGRTLGVDYISVIADFIKRNNLFSTEYSPSQLSWVLALSVTSLVIPYFVRPLYFFFYKWKFKFDSDFQVNFMILSKLFKESPLDDLLWNAVLSQDTVMITFEDRKVYVGTISTMGEVTENKGADQEIRLYPILSGYRDKDKLTVDFTTSYEKAGLNLPVILRQEGILSVRKYDFETHEKFKE